MSIMKVEEAQLNLRTMLVTQYNIAVKAYSIKQDPRGYKPDYLRKEWGAVVSPNEIFILSVVNTTQAKCGNLPFEAEADDGAKIPVIYRTASPPMIGIRNTAARLLGTP